MKPTLILMWKFYSVNVEIVPNEILHYLFVFPFPCNHFPMDSFRVNGLNLQSYFYICNVVSYVIFVLDLSVRIERIDVFHTKFLSKIYSKCNV